MTDIDVAELVAEMTPIVRATSRMALQWYRRPLTVEDKGIGPGFDPVTEADKSIEQALRAEIGRRWPDHAIVGEEQGATGDGPWRWVIDPIDGTRAFICGLPLWGTLVGVQHDGTPLAGWMHLPALDETYVGAEGEAWMETPSQRRRLATRATTNVTEAVVGCTHPSMFATSPEVAAWARVADRVRMVRYGGDCAIYGALALGHVDAVIENQLRGHDIVPLVPIIEAAGGVVTDVDGATPIDGGFVVAAATAELHEALLDLVHGRRPGSSG